MPKKSPKVKIGHIVLKDAEHDRHGGIFALCGTYLPASYERNDSPHQIGCLGCLSQNTRDFADALADAHDGFVDLVAQRFDNVEKGAREAIREAIQAERQAWMAHLDRATLRIERLETKVAKMERKQAKKKGGKR